MTNFRQPFFDKSYSLGYMRPLVWFSEHCIFEFSQANKVFRQTFWHGTPLGEHCERPLNGKIPLIGFNFTLPTQPFEQVTLEIDRLKDVITSWEEQRFAKASNMRPMLHKKWCQQSKHHYSLRICTEPVKSNWLHHKIHPLEHEKNRYCYPI